MSQFFATKSTFANIIGFDNTESLSYESWMALPDSYKSAALFVNFYPAIKSAWESAKGGGVDEEDGIETALQYLEKNVDKIKGNPKRYTPNYIYTIAWNSIGCLRRTKAAQLRPRFEVSNIIGDVDGELDLFDTIPDCKTDYELDIDKNSTVDKFWEEVEELFIPRDKNGNITDDHKVVMECRKYEKVISHLLNGEGLGKARAKVIDENPNDPLLPISVSKKDKERIVKELRAKFEKYKDVILGTNLVPATDEDLIPIPARKESKVGNEIYAYIRKVSKLSVEDAIRMFAVTSDGYKKMMFARENAGEPIKAHWVDDGTPTQEVDYFYMVRR